VYKELTEGQDTPEQKSAMDRYQSALLILDVARWPDFGGCWPIPGITAAEFEVRTPGMAGSRIRVTNTDESSHIEEIVEWQPDHRLQLERPHR
jgi:hypothetical protein